MTHGNFQKKSCIELHVKFKYIFIVNIINNVKLSLITNTKSVVINRAPKEIPQNELHTLNISRACCPPNSRNRFRMCFKLNYSSNMYKVLYSILM